MGVVADRHLFVSGAVDDSTPQIRGDLYREASSWVDLLMAARPPAPSALDELDFIRIWAGAELYHQRPIRDDLVKVERALNAAGLSFRSLLPWSYIDTTVDLWKVEWSKPARRGGRLQAKRRRTLEAIALVLADVNVSDRARPVFAAELARLRDLAPPPDARQRLIPGLRPGFRRVKATSRASPPIEWAAILSDAYRILQAKKVRPALQTLTTVLGLLFPSVFSPAHVGLDERVRAILKSAKRKGR